MNELLTENKIFKFPIKSLDAFLFLIIWVVVQWLYPVFVVEYYSFMGYYFHFNIVKFIIANLWVLLLLKSISNKGDIRFFIEAMLLLLFVLPNAVLFEFHPLYSSVIFTFVVIAYFIVWFVLEKVNIREKWLSKLPVFSDKLSLYVLVLLSILFITPFIIVFGFRIDWNVLFFKDIYEVRRQVASFMTPAMGYLFGNLVKVIFPVGMILALSKKKYLIFTLFFIFQFYLFLVLAHKSVFLSLFLVSLFFIRSYKRQVRLILFSLAILLVVFHLIFIISGIIMPESILLRRGLLTPALLNIYYFDFFAGKHTYLAYSFCSHCIEYPFDLAPPHLIGREFFNNALTSANNGFLSDGFANWGYVGVILYSVLVAIYFKIIEVAKLSWKYSGVLIIVIYTLLSSSLTTAMLTHGLFLFLLLVLFVLRK
jgi:hypothetical protein